ncbi:MAG: PKD domain-containing protein [Thermoplasmata archaeon]|nr:PKD domain-containing protein [Thermoplasmata archaeon]
MGLRASGRCYSGGRLGAILVAAALLATILPLGHFGGPSSSTQGSAESPNGLVVPAFLPGPSIATIGQLPADQPISIDITLSPADPNALSIWANTVSTPGSSSYRHFLSAPQTASRFGASSASMAAAASYFEPFGLSVSVSPDHLFLSVAGPSHAVAAAFHTSFVEYGSGSTRFFSHPSPASLPPVAPWYGVLGLGSIGQIRPLVAPLKLTPAAGSCSGSFPITPCAMATAYDYAGLLASGKNGTGERIGVVDVFDSSERPNTLASDAAQFSSEYSLPKPNVTFVFPTASQSFLNGTGPDGWSVEDALDLQWAHGSAPGAAITVALAPNTNPGLYGAVDSLVSTRAVDVLSLSWGEPDLGAFNTFSMACNAACNASSDGSYAMLHPVLEAAAVEGIGVFVASGDCGSADGTGGVATDYPASDPYATGVGGTLLTLNNDATYSSELAWSGNATGSTNPGCQNQGGSGGGYAPFPRPAWQRGTGLGAFPTHRGVPDVSIDAASGAALVYQGSDAAASGTSLGSPVWAGIAAIADQVAGTRLGFLSPSLYGIFRSAQYGNAFHDVASGGNGYPATTGWDAITGIGSPIAGVLLPLLANEAPTHTNLTVLLNATVRTGTVPLNVTFHANATGGSGSYSAFDVSFGDGNSTWSTTPTASYSFTVPGAYPASVTVFDANGNSTLSPPVTIVVGGGSLLPVNLSASRTTLPVGGSVIFQVRAATGTAPYTVAVDFGDGTYSIPAVTGTVTHVFSGAGGYCAAAVVSDAAHPENGGNSTPLALSVGGVTRPHCGQGPALSVAFGANYTTADLPGDIPLRETVSGGVPPLTTWIDSSDPYSTLCQCGVFRTTGVHTVDLVVNDSVGDSSLTPLSVTLFNPLVGNFTSSALSGAAPLGITFGVALSGGYLPQPSLTSWSFGDGGNATGTSVSHTYSTPGEYLAVGDAWDGGHGNASEAFLVDVLPASGGSVPTVTATVSPAIHGATGFPVNFSATVSGTGGPYSTEWIFSDGSSSFGSRVSESFGWNACANLTACPLGVSLVVRSALGASTVEPFTLPKFLALTGDALTVTDPGLPAAGTTPFTIRPNVGATGIPGVAVNLSFGDGSSFTGGATVHSYLNPGNYTLTAQVRDAGGDLWVRHHALSVNGSAITALAAHISPSNVSGLAPYSVLLSATPSGGYGPFSYHWLLGNGNTSASATTTAVYATPGHYVVNLTMNDSIGQSASATTVVFAFGVTSVGFSLGAPNSAVTSGSEFPISLDATPACNPVSLPSCASAAIPVTVELDPPPGVSGGARDVTSFSLAPNTVLNSKLAAPAIEGSWLLVVKVANSSYSGSASTSVEVNSPAANAAGELILLVAVGIAVAAILAILLLNRRSRTPPPPPSTLAPPAPPAPVTPLAPPPPP